MGEPARVLNHQIENIAMHHQVLSAVDADMDRGFDDLDAAEMRAVVIPQELVVIARDINEPGALARLAQHFLHEFVV